jgi:hypothetical protein
MAATNDASNGGRPATPPGPREALRAEFPLWNIWPSDAGHWYATRRQGLRRQAAQFRLWRMVDAGDLEGLRVELVIQVGREQIAVAVLGSLW